MKIELLKDVMLPANGTRDKPNVGEPVIGSIGDVVEITDFHAKDWIKRGLAKESEGAVTIETKEDGEGGEQHVVTSATLKPGADRAKKVVVGAPEATK